MPSTEPVKITPLDEALNRLCSQNDRLINLIVSIEQIGNKVQNTNFPKVADDNKKPESKAPDGLLESIHRQLDLTTQYNTRLEELYNKLRELL